MLKAEQAIAAFSSGLPVVLVNSESPDTEGTLVIGAEFATAEAVNFMVTQARGIVCLCLSPERCKELELEVISPSASPRPAPRFTLSIEARHGVTTGISAADRAKTIATAIDPASGPQNLVTPGHILPIQVAEGGVLERGSKAEAAFDLARLAGLGDGAVLCGILGEDGDMARLPELRDFCARHELGMIEVGEVALERLVVDGRVERVSIEDVDTRFGEFRLLEYEESPSGNRHLVLLRGDIREASPAPIVHIHFGDPRNDLRGAILDAETSPLTRALSTIREEGVGAVVYLLRDDLTADRGADESTRATLEGAYLTGCLVLADLGATVVRTIEPVTGDRELFDRAGISMQRSRPLVSSN